MSPVGQSTAPGRALGSNVSFNRIWTLLLAACLPAVSAADRACALTPDSPAVRAGIERAVAYLTSKDRVVDVRLGARVLSARVLLYENKADHPQVAEAIVAIDQALSQSQEIDIYSLGLAIVLLTEIDPAEHRARLDRLVARLVGYQKPHGGWGYSYQPTGDTSMTQYAVLGLWSADHAGIDTPREAWMRVTGWLIRTQDPGGGWGYQGADPGKFDRVRQTEVRSTLSLAALGSLYLCGDYLRIAPLPPRRREDIPAAFREVEIPEPAGPQADAAELADHWKRAVLDGAAWWAQHEQDRVDKFVSYYCYTLERTETFRETFQQRSISEPAWYTRTAEALLARQTAEGAWNGDEGTQASTALGALFLLRSARRTLEATPGLGAGTLVGGRGLPAGEEAVSLSLGQVRGRPLEGPAEALLERLKDTRHPEFYRALDQLDQLTAESRTKDLAPLAETLEKLAGGRSPEARASAIRALGRTREIDHVPLFIHALSDADPRVVAAAREALAFIARKPTVRSTGSDEPGDRAVEIEGWRRWYESIRPYSHLPR